MSNLDDYTAEQTVDAAPSAVFRALTTTEGLAAWWTRVSGDGLAGGELVFAFGPGAFVTMRVDVAEPGAEVQWSVLDCHLADWIGTRLRFEIAPTANGGAIVRMRHVGLTPAVECFSDCKSGWDHFMPSLKAYVETGTGNPNGSDADRTRREARAGVA